jgi:2-keto-3-deoxy-L-rhamnonate aldolase RhmA
MIETAVGLKHVDEIAAVPGVGAIFIGAGADLSQYPGVPQTSPVAEQCPPNDLAACKVHNVPCGITALTRDEADRRNQGRLAYDQDRERAVTLACVGPRSQRSWSRRQEKAGE